MSKDLPRINVPPHLTQWAIGIVPVENRRTFELVYNWILDNKIPHELHAARVRFRPHTALLRTQFYLQYSHLCYTVDEPYPTVF